MNKVLLALVIIAFLMSCSPKPLVERSKTVWVDPAYQPDSSAQLVVVWFEDQFLPHGDSFREKKKEFSGLSRSQVRDEVVGDLKAMSHASFDKIKPRLYTLEDEGLISDIKRHWIINGFSCSVSREGMAELKTLEGVSKIFAKQRLSRSRGDDMGPEYLSEIPPNSFDVDAVTSYPWNIEKIRAPEVWRELGIIGAGSLNVVHDSGFKLDVPPLAETIYVNKGEIPGNGIDEDSNGYIDDYHGYHFDEGKANLNQPVIRRGTNIHGNLCAAMIVGTFEKDAKQAIGISPGSKWAPVIGSSNIEEAVQWAIEQGADTYSMSFSQPNLGEYRTHWRKVLEHGTMCGVVFISGAGNFASGRNAAPVPVQMRNPEHIPDAVLGVAGVGEDGERPPFSSQGPVVWDTEHYNEGEVRKPDFTTFNFGVPCIDPEGYLTNRANGNSLAGPHMAGIVSLMFSADPELLPWEIKDILITVAEDIGDEGFDFQSGHGFVNAYDAVKAVLD